MKKGRKRGEIDPSLEAPIPHVERKGRPPDPKRKCPVEHRHCQRHGVTEFALYSAGPNRGPRWKCKRCVGEAVTRRLQKVKRILVAEAGGRCCVCGYDSCIINLHFHHVDPRKKSFSMTVAMGRSLAALREEARKCVLVCANCHGEIEAGVIECPPLGATYAAWRAA
jgi:cytochrome c553